MLIVTAIVALLAAALHVFIFIMESFQWTSDSVRARFGTTPEQAEATKEMALNQGYYNLFLGVIAAVGAVFLLSGGLAIGAALVYAGTGSMLLAATVLALTSPDKRRAAATQGLFPLLSVVALSIALVIG
ncbi:MAG: DUF1304 domain-containing protein [Mycetocola sp.]